MITCIHISITVFSKSVQVGEEEGSVGGGGGAAQRGTK